ncbi:copper transporter [Kineococcus sp. NUM-3379]
MIDFRYHLVSLVSVFLALAVGIVLGAGPLKEGIDAGVTDQVRQLTAEKADLRSQLDAADRAIAARDEWSEAVTPELLTGTLTGRDVVLVLLPGAEPALADGVAAAVEVAGGAVTGRVSIQDSWTDPEQQAARASVAAQARARDEPFPSASPSGGRSDEVELAAALARGIVIDLPARPAGDPTPTATPDPAAGAAVAPLLSAGLVTGEVSRPATLAVVVAAPADTDPSAPQTEARSASLLALAAQLDAASTGTVVAGPMAASAEEGLIAEIRAQDAVSEAVSTVDDADVPMGRVSVAMALAEQARGAAGHYGIATSADAVAPARPTPAPVP